MSVDFKCFSETVDADCLGLFIASGIFATGSAAAMPSDLAKKKAAKKKEAAKSRSRTKKPDENGEGGGAEGQEDGAASNGKGPALY